MRASSTCTPASARRSEFVLQVLRRSRSAWLRSGDLAFLVLVVWIARRHRAQRGFGLDVDETLVVVDVVDRLGRIHHLPDDHRGDLDRRTVEFVDLELAALEVAHALADLALGVEGVVPAQAVLSHRADVLAEQAEHRRLVGFTMYSPSRQKPATSTSAMPIRVPARWPDRALPREQVAAHQHQGDQDQQYRDAGQGTDGVFFHGGLSSPGMGAIG